MGDLMSKHKFLVGDIVSGIILPEISIGYIHRAEILAQNSYLLDEEHTVNSYRIKILSGKDNLKAIINDVWNADESWLTFVERPMGKLTPYKFDLISHPKHYTTGKIEVLEFLEDKKLGFHESNAIQYICRAEHKGNQLEDLQKAVWYLKRKIEILEAERDGRIPKRPNEMNDDKQMILKDLEIKK